MPTKQPSKSRSKLAKVSARTDAPVAPQPLTYAKAGVNIGEGDRFVDMIMQHMRRTHGPRVISNEGGFAGLFRLDFNESLFKRNFKDPVLVACTDRKSVV